MPNRSWKEIEKGAIIKTPGKAKEHKTGDWRGKEPLYDQEKCSKCGLCYVYCPDAAISMLDTGFVSINYFHCKGCGICAVECPKKAITMVSVGKAKK